MTRAIAIADHLFESYKNYSTTGEGFEMGSSGVGQNSFDFVIATMTFNDEVVTTNGAFGNALELAKPGGYIIVTPNPSIQVTGDAYEVLENDARISRLILRKNSPKETEEPKV